MAQTQSPQSDTPPRARAHRSVPPQLVAPAVEPATAHIDAAGASHAGQERASNEDQYLVASMHRRMAVHETSLVLREQRWFAGSPEGVVLAVADGIGGHGSGAVASATALRTVAMYVCEVMPWADRYALLRPAGPGAAPHLEVQAGLRRAVAQGQAGVERVARHPEVRSRLGTTLTVAYVAWPQLYVAHIGDSRCYLWRGGKLTQWTTDHTVGQQLDGQGIELGETSPWRDVLAKALGGGTQTNHVPDVFRARLEHGDLILVCTDGLTAELGEEQIVEVLQTERTAAETCQFLVQRANEAGGRDNITVVAARMPQPPADPQQLATGG